MARRLDKLRRTWYLSQMRRGLRLASWVLLLGACLSGTAGGASLEQSQAGGIFQISLNIASGIDSMDPALASTPPAWALLDTTCARLMSYPDKPLPQSFRPQPEVAAAQPVVSRGGRTYTFVIRRGFRFSDGSPVGPKAFVRAINRLLAPEMSSPGVQYARDIVGAGRVLRGQATAATGVVARGNKLVVRLAHPAPDFPSRTASTFFCAVPPRLPINAEGEGVFPAAGPYHVVEYRRGERVELRRNPYYGGRRPHHVDGFDVDLRAASPHEVLRRVDRGEADWGHTLSAIYFDPTLGLVEKYGLNRSQHSQLQLRRGLTLRLLAFNSARPLFRDNPALRRAVNLALDRRAIVNLGGPLVSRPSDQHLPALLPGFRNADVYPLERANLRKARKLAKGNLRSRKAVLYVNNSAPPMAVAQLIKAQLAEIGLQVEVRGIPLHSASAPYFKRLATKGEPWDLAFGLWYPAHIDQYAYVNLLFDRRHLGVTNFTRFASPEYDLRMRRAAARPFGKGRTDAYAALDAGLARGPAPVAVVDVLNEPTLVSNRVGCVVLRPMLDLTSVCLVT